MATANGTIHVEIDPNQPLPERYLGTGEDGPQYGPMSLYDAIVETAARNLVEKALKEDGLKESYRTLVDRVKQIRDEEIREAIAPIIADALARPLHKTNQYGEAVGQETTLRELLGDEVRAQLKTRDRNGYGSDKDTVLSKFIRDEVNRALTDELKEALDAGKSEVLKVLRQKGTATMEEALRKALPR